MPSLRLRVVFPNQRVVSVDVQGSDTARTVVLSGPPLKHAVVLLHHGRCLSPYLSLEVQGVASGDLIVLHAVPGAAHARRAPARADADAGDGLFLEMLRLADLAFLPYEIASAAALVYQQTWDDEQAEEEEQARERAPAPTVVAARPAGVSCEQLPPIWADQQGE
jgi:hypothetical protein